MKSKILVVVFCFSIAGLYAQSNLNAYKYVIVPKKFDFQKTEDQYQLSSLTKFLFNKEEFTAMLDGDQRPQDLFDSPCLGLEVNAINNSGMLSTKLTLELKNCRNEIVFTSTEGKSKLKEYKRGYQEALRRAFESVKGLDYKYDASLASSLKPKVEMVKPTLDSQPKIKSVVKSQPKMEEAKPVNEPIEIIEEVVEDEVGIQEIDTKAKEVVEMVNSDDILYAQSKFFGFQLIDSVPSVIYLLQKTSTKDLFILKDKNGIIYKKNEKWIAEYYEKGQLVQKELNIKF